MSTPTISTEGKQDGEGVSELQCQGSQISTCVIGDDSITTDLRQHFLLESNTVNIKLPLSDTIKEHNFYEAWINRQTALETQQRYAKAQVAAKEILIIH